MFRKHFIEEHCNNEEIENQLDPAGIQEIADCEYEGMINHPEFPNIDFETIENGAGATNNK